MANELTVVEYQSLSGIQVRLTADTVRNTITRGNGKITDQEVAMFLRTCQAKRLDPLENGETWLIKYDDKAPAQMVVGYFAYIRRADRFPDYRGFRAGICVAYQNKDGQYLVDKNGMPVVRKKEGAAVYKALGEVLIGGWCEVMRERSTGNTETTYMEVTLDEYSTGKSNWSAKPATMVRKVAVSQAFRAAFPNEYEGLYTEEEMVAAGAVPVVDPNTGEVLEEVHDDPVISQEQRQALFKMAKHLGPNFAEILKEMIGKRGYDSTTNLPLSVYNAVLAEVTELAAKIQEEQAANKQENGKPDDPKNAE